MVTEWSLPGNSTDEANATFASYDPSSSDLYILKNTSPPGIISLDTLSNNITRWTFPHNLSNITSFSRGFDGYYFTYENISKVGRIDPSANNITEWTIRDNVTGFSDGGYDLSTGVVYFTSAETNNVGRWIPDNGITTEWKVKNSPLSLTIAPSGSIYFTDALDRIGRIS